MLSIFLFWSHSPTPTMNSTIVFSHFIQGTSGAQATAQRLANDTALQIQNIHAAVKAKKTQAGVTVDMPSLIHAGSASFVL